ncbi:HPP family protein [Actinomycetospora cinnamomea]|uniref:CBS domain protein n=1 Tax=Actinomycetospora cinnamomea TaxID=663609 RepID=A0A2U1F3T1_9PSEU|nr:CBS domain-containing protein [Actinomycetospora cinnamomea]PVZ06834.1 CBS domain protein [Actinomycetospora cinnamomea]
MVLRAREVMTRRVVTAMPQTPLTWVRDVLAENRFSALPVVDERHRLVGIVTTLDVLRADAGGGLAGKRVGAVMTRNPMHMTPDADVRIIAHRLRRYGERRVMPIVEHGVLAGIVTRGDLLRRPATGGPVGRWWHRLRHPERRHLIGWGDEERAGRCAADLMTPLEDVLWVEETTPTAVAAALLAENRLTALPVLDEDDHLVGIVSEADLVPDRLTGRRTAAPTTVGGIMSADTISVRDRAPVEDLVRAVAARGLRLVPVVDADDRVVGVVSRGDLLRAEQTTEQTTERR